MPERSVPDSSSILALECPLEISLRGEQTRLVLGQQSTTAPSLLLTAVARARSWAEGIAAGEITSLEQLVQTTGLSRRYIQRIIRLAALSPARIEQLVDQPGQQTPPMWRVAIHLFLDWTRQIDFFEA